MAMVTRCDYASTEPQRLRIYIKIVTYTHTHTRVHTYVCVYNILRTIVLDMGQKACLIVYAQPNLPVRFVFSS